MSDRIKSPVKRTALASISENSVANVANQLDNKALLKLMSSPTKSKKSSIDLKLGQYEITFPPGSMGLELEPVIISSDRHLGCRVKDFYFGPDFIGVDRAYLESNVCVGDVIASIDGESVLSWKFKDILANLRNLSGKNRHIIFKNISASWQAKPNGNFGDATQNLTQSPKRRTTTSKSLPFEIYSDAIAASRHQVHEPSHTSVSFAMTPVAVKPSPTSASVSASDCQLHLHSASATPCPTSASSARSSSSLLSGQPDRHHHRHQSHNAQHSSQQHQSQHHSQSHSHENLLSPQAVRNISRNTSLSSTCSSPIPAGISSSNRPHNTTSTVEAMPQVQAQSALSLAITRAIPPDLQRVLATVGCSLGTGMLQLGATMSMHATDAALALGDVVGEQAEHLVGQAADRMPRYSALHMREVVGRKQDLLQELSRASYLLANAQDQQDVVKSQGVEIVNLQATVQAQQRSHEELLTQLASLGQQLTVAKSDNAVLQQSASHLQDRLSSCSSSASEAHIRLTAAENTVTELSKSLQGKTAELSLTDQVLRVHQREIETERRSRAEEQAAWRDELARMTDEQLAVRQEMQVAFDHAVEQLQATERARDSATAELEVLRDISQSQKMSAETEYSRFRENMHSQQSWHNQRLMEKENENLTLKRDVTVMEGKLDSLQATVAGLRSQCDCHAADLVSSNARHDALVRELEIAVQCRTDTERFLTSAQAELAAQQIQASASANQLLQQISDMKLQFALKDRSIEELLVRIKVAEEALPVVTRHHELIVEQLRLGTSLREQELMQKINAETSLHQDMTESLRQQMISHQNEQDEVAKTCRSQLDQAVQEAADSTAMLVDLKKQVELLRKQEAQQMNSRQEEQGHFSEVTAKLQAVSEQAEQSAKLLTAVQFQLQDAQDRARNTDQRLQDSNRLLTKSQIENVELSSQIDEHVNIARISQERVHDITENHESSLRTIHASSESMQSALREVRQSVSEALLAERLWLFSNISTIKEKWGCERAAWEQENNKQRSALEACQLRLSEAMCRAAAAESNTISTEERLTAVLQQLLHADAREAEEKTISSTMNSMYSELSGQVQTLEQELHGTAALLSAAKTRSDELSQSLVQAQAMHVEAESRHADSLSSLRQQLHDTEQQCVEMAACLQRSTDQSQDVAEGFRLDRARLITSYETQINETLATHQHSVELMAQEIGEDKIQLQLTKAALLQTELTADEDKNRIQNDLNETQLKCQQFQARVNSLTTELAQERSNSTELNQQLSQLQHQTTELQRSAEICQELQSRLAQAQGTIQEFKCLTSKNTLSHQSSVSSLESQLQSQSSQSAELTSALAAARLESSDLQRMLTNSTQAITQLQQQASARDKDIQHQKQVASDREKLLQLNQGQLAAAEQQVRATLEQLQAEHELSSASAKESTHCLQRAAAESDRLRHEQTTVQTRCDELFTVLRSQQAALDEAVKREGEHCEIRQRLEQALQVAEGQARCALTALTSANEEHTVSMLQQQLSASSAVIFGLEHHVKELSVRLASSCAEAIAAQQAVLNKTAEYDALSQQVTELLASVTSPVKPSRSHTQQPKELRWGAGQLRQGTRKSKGSVHVSSVRAGRVQLLVLTAIVKLLRRVIMKRHGRAGIASRPRQQLQHSSTDSVHKLDCYLHDNYDNDIEDVDDVCHEASSYSHSQVNRRRTQWPGDGLAASTHQASALTRHKGGIAMKGGIASPAAEQQLVASSSLSLPSSSSTTSYLCRRAAVLEDDDAVCSSDAITPKLTSDLLDLMNSTGTRGNTVRRSAVQENQSLDTSSDIWNVSSDDED